MDETGSNSLKTFRNKGLRQLGIDPAFEEAGSELKADSGKRAYLAVAGSGRLKALELDRRSLPSLTKDLQSRHRNYPGGAQ
jgi:hypothetical protein